MECVSVSFSRSVTLCRPIFISDSTVIPYMSDSVDRVLQVKGYHYTPAADTGREHRVHVFPLRRVNFKGSPVDL